MSVSYGGDSITFADGSVSSSGWTGFKNRFINGGMVIDQRNAGASVSAVNNTYSLDRWICNSYNGSAVAGKFTIQQNAGSVTPPAGYINYLGITSSSASSTTINDIYTIQQRIEGLNVADLGWGTANAQSITISFWVRSSLTGTFGGSIQNSSQNRSYPFTYTINAANTWELETITIPGDTSGTWLTTNATGLVFQLSLGAGSTYSGTAGAWASANYTSATGASYVLTTNGATFYITGVQLEKGSTASSFEYRPYTTELQLCQRYYCKTYAQDIKPGSVTSTTLAVGRSTDATSNYTTIAQWSFPVTMRVTPSITTYNADNGSTSTFRGDGTNYSSPQVLYANPYAVSINASNVTVGQSVYVAVHIVASSEL